MQRRWCVAEIRVCSVNNFPTAAGLASSAAGYACLVAALAEVFGVADTELSSIARMGSGSACRSVKKNPRNPDLPTTFLRSFLFLSRTGVHVHHRRQCCPHAPRQRRPLRTTQTHTPQRYTFEQVYGGWVRWTMGDRDDGVDSIASQVRVST